MTLKFRLSQAQFQTIYAIYHSTNYGSEWANSERIRQWGGFHASCPVLVRFGLIEKGEWFSGDFVHVGFGRPQWKLTDGGREYARTVMYVRK